MASPGPAPKRASERLRTNTPGKGDARVGQLRPVKRPTISKEERADWHPRAVKWFQSLSSSGQSDYFQDSDWEFARVLADYLTRFYGGKDGAGRRLGAMDTKNLFDGMAKLGTTEGDRRQLLRIELEHEQEQDVSSQEKAVDAYMQVLKGGKPKGEAV